MSRYRWVPEEGLLRVIRQALSGPAREVCLAAVVRYLGRQPDSPELVGSTAAAKILGVLPPHISRLKEQGRMPKPIEVDGSVDVYHRVEVEALARELEAEREARERKRREREVADEPAA